MMSNKKAKELLDRANKIIPRGTQTMSKGADMWVIDESFPIMAKRGKGCMMTSVDGVDFIDTMGALGPNILGYCNRAVNKAVKDQFNKGVIFSIPSPIETELAELLCDVIPCCEMVRYCKNGSDAVSAAIRLCRAIKGKDYILHPNSGYHGWSDSIAAASQRPYGIPEVLGRYVHKFEYNNLADLEKKLKTQRYACVLMEPVSLDAPRPGYLQGVRELCDKYNTLLVFDEMITGFRWSLGGAQEYYDVVPDLATFGKAVSNGMPLSFICGKEKYMKALDYVFFSATFFGETLSLAAAIATIKQLQNKKIFEHIWKYGNIIKKEFKKYCDGLGVDAEVLGMAPRLNFKFNHEDEVGVRDLFHKEMIKRGIFIGIQFYTIWAMKKRHIDQILQAMRESLEIVAKALKENKLDEYLGGQRSMTIFKRQ